MIRLYDTFAREKREFVPADPARVTMYVCGPTVYNRAHIGNARPAVVFDVLARLLRHTYGEGSLIYARNVTDVDDKIIAAARAEGVEPGLIAERFERFYVDDMAALGVAAPDLAPRATENIDAMIRMTEWLISLGNAYEAAGHVLFHVPSDPGYGALGRRDREAMIAGARVEVATYKRDPADFVLWKPSPEGMIGWDSPWGRGRPGWHIECSAMIERHLGETIDIHAGGLDLIFPHHENELAQSRCAHRGVPLANYWLHNGFLSMAGSDKMSKSLGNVVTVGDLLAQGHKGEVLRLALLSAHYRQPLEWSENLIATSKSRLDRMHYVCSFPADRMPPDQEFVSALQYDLNTPKALSILSRLTSKCFDDLSLGMGGELSDAEEDRVFQNRGVLKASGILMGFRLGGRMPIFKDDDVARKLELRARAREAKLYEEADRIRRDLEEGGYILIDTPKETLLMTDEPMFEEDDEDA